MKSDHSFAKSFSIKTLAAAIAACAIAPPFAHAGPTGGVVVDGNGSITQSGVNTRVDQVSDRLSLEWDTFNVGRNERVQFVQPGADAIALNRILDNSGSQILGRIDANGQVILMNPNGIIFGRDAVINVGGLVASGLNISSDDFMNGDLVFSGLEGTAGTVVNRGIINAAVGGNVALLGKSVNNQGFISAELGHVALASGTEAIVTFDDEGLLGVRIDQATLAEEIGTAYAVTNGGTIEAKGGKILLNATASADLFSAAVNSGGMGNNGVEFHDDGSFSIGIGNNVMNSGRLDVSTEASSDNDAGIIILAGDNIEHRGTISADASGTNKAGAVYLKSWGDGGAIRLAGTSQIEAIADNTSGKIYISGDAVRATSGSAALTTSGNTYLKPTYDLRIPKIISENLLISLTGTVTQAAPAEVAGVTRITGVHTDVRLTNSTNDFNVVKIDTNLWDSITITDRNDVVLGEIEMSEASLRVNALGEGATISQVPGSRLLLTEGTLRLSADNIVLGEGGATTVHIGGPFQLDFGRSISTNDSISLSGDVLLRSRGQIRGIDREYGDVFLTLRGDHLIDLNAEYDANSYQLHLHGMKGDNATLSGASTEVTQTAPIFLTGTLTWNSYAATLTNPENNIVSLQGSGGPAFGWLTYVDKNDLTLRNLVTGDEVSLDVKSVGEGNTIRQAANTALRADFINLEADNLMLGASGRSSIYAGYALDLKFGDNMTLNGPWAMSGWYAPMFSIIGDDSDNRLVFGPHATNDAFSREDLLAHLEIQLLGGDDTIIFDSPFPVGNAEYFGVNSIDMGSGNDRAVFNQSVGIPLILGEGIDVLRARGAAGYYVEDFNPNEDQIVIVSP